MKKVISSGLFWISLIMILLISAFLIFWDVLNLADKLQPEYIATVSRVLKISIILTVVVSLAGIF